MKKCVDCVHNLFNWEWCNFYAKKIKKIKRCSVKRKKGDSK